MRGQGHNKPSSRTALGPPWTGQVPRRAVLSAAVVAAFAATGMQGAAAGTRPPAAGPSLAVPTAATRNKVYSITERSTGSSTTYPRAEFRGLWVASVLNIDWPSAPGLGAAAQQAELRSWLDLAVSRNLNSVLLQVRPAADRMWQSTVGEPWSVYLTGTQGKSPGYDPLAYAIEQAHRRGLQLHAWINPFRVSMGTSLTSLVASHPARQNPSWSFAYGGRRYYNPGIPAVRSFIRQVVRDLVSNYDVDGIHFDDYFYPYPVSGASIPDSAAYAQYKGSSTSVEAWRRNNVDVFVRYVYKDIKALKPRVVFGISPFGIWRNSTSSSLGSATSGLESYSALYADTRKWVRSGWVDYILPQLYWYQGFPAADYNVLVDWWARQVSGTSVKLYTGEAAYRVGDASIAAWQDPNELRDHVAKGRSVAAVRGQAYYNATAVRQNKLGAFGILEAQKYARKSLTVPMPHLEDRRPYTPVIKSAAWDGTGVRLSWYQSNSGEPATEIAVWRWESTGSVLPKIQSTATNLRAVRRRTASTQVWVDTGAVRGTSYWYMVQSVSRTGIDSPRATAIFIRA